MVPEEAMKEKKSPRQLPLPAKTWKQTPPTITIALTVTVFAVVVDIAGTTRVAEALVGAAVGVGIVQFQWETEAGTTGVAVAGGIVGTAAAILQSLAGSHSLTVSVAAATVGAAIVAAAKTQLQWAIDKIQCAVDKLQSSVLIVQSGGSHTESTASEGVSNGVIGLFGGLLKSPCSQKLYLLKHIFDHQNDIFKCFFL